MLCRIPDENSGEEGEGKDSQLSTSAFRLKKILKSDGKEILCKATRADSGQPLLLRLFNNEAADIENTGFQSQVKRLGCWLVLLSVLFVFTSTFWVMVWLKQNGQKNSLPKYTTGYEVFGKYANRYAKGICFLAVDYWLEKKGKIIYRSKAEGTCFLADRQGYLITNRHVACPWLVDFELQQRIEQQKRWDVEHLLKLRYKRYLWLEGEKAFYRSPELNGSENPDDLYILKPAFTDGGTNRLSTAWVGNMPTSRADQIRNRLVNDFAVLKIDPVPEQIPVLPLAADQVSKEMPLLTPVICMGFPLGRRALDNVVRVSVTRGSVRRSFPDLIQIDASIYGGNSGGPVIDQTGRVIGIASRVGLSMPCEAVSRIDLLSDFGLVLPIRTVSEFLNEVKEGQLKWNGEIDPALDSKIEKIQSLAAGGRWEDAVLQVEEFLSEVSPPELLTAAGMIYLAVGKRSEAKVVLEKAISVQPDNYTAMFGSYLLDWVAFQPERNRYRDYLLGLDWRSLGEFQGYLIRILEGKINVGSATGGSGSENERMWIHYVLGLTALRDGYRQKGIESFKRVLLTGNSVPWAFALARSALEKVIGNNEIFDHEKRHPVVMDTDRLAFFNEVEEKCNEWRLKREEIDRLWGYFYYELSPLAEKRQTLEKIVLLKPADDGARIMLVMYNAMDDAWEKALEQTQLLLGRLGRESGNRLGIGLMEALILKKMGRVEAAKECLTLFRQQIRDPWYQSVSDCLLGRISAEVLMDNSGGDPERLLSAHSAIGLWLENDENPNEAVHHYRNGLETYLNDCLEYDLCQERLKRLRKPMLEG